VTFITDIVEIVFRRDPLYSRTFNTSKFGSFFMPQTGVYELYAPIVAVHSVHDDWGHTRLLTIQIPSGEEVRVTGCPTTGNLEPFIAAEWLGKHVFLFAVDLQDRGALVSDSAPDISLCAFAAA
jgi:hypothetical protein